LTPYLQNLAASSVERAKSKFAFSLPFPLIYVLMFLSHSNVCLRLQLCSLPSDSTTKVLYVFQSTYYKFHSPYSKTLKVVSEKNVCEFLIQFSTFSFTSFISFRVFSSVFSQRTSIIFILLTKKMPYLPIL